jgi:hypothetical protein
MGKMINQLQSFLPKHWVVSVMIVMGMLRFLTHHWLVVWNVNFMFPYIGNVIIPTDEHFVSEG